MSQHAESKKPDFFDYLPPYGNELQEHLELNQENGYLETEVAYYRQTGRNRPSSICRDIRTLAETMLSNQMKEDEQQRRDTKQYDRIIDARDAHVITDAQSRLFDSIRQKGNDAAHYLTKTNANDCRVVLQNLDDLLRSYVTGFNLSVDFKDSAAPSNEIFTDVNTDTIRKNAALTSEITNDPEYQKKTIDALIEQYERQQMLDAIIIERQNKELEQLRMINESLLDSLSEEDIQAQSPIQDTDDVLEQIQRDEEAAKKAVVQANYAVEQASRQVKEILKERDFIRRLLGNDSRATDAQHRVMAFPANPSSPTRFLHVTGGGGTGKTLCLVAKLIKDARAQKRCLFVTFNRPLTAYVTGLLESFPSEKEFIDVVNYDLLVNSLAKGSAITEPNLEYLAQYATDVRYPKGWIIEYETGNKFVKPAMNAVAQRHPELSSEYYLDANKQQNVDWLNAEIQWIEERYASTEDAKQRYLSDARTGRGGNRRPSEQIRSIILEIWGECLELAHAQHAYTIAQATKKLMDSHTLPGYDSIAIDEAQDFSLLRIKLLAKFRRNEQSFLYLAGDLKQKIYQRDFTWIELEQDSNTRGYSITLKKNLRNPESIRKFAQRLENKKCPHDDACADVVVRKASEEEVVDLARELSTHQGETTVIVGNTTTWQHLCKAAGLSIQPIGGKGKRWNSDEGGLFCSGPLIVKGLEFDNVIVDCSYNGNLEGEALINARNVHFTRARKKLFVTYNGEVPQLLKDYYQDFLTN